MEYRQLGSSGLRVSVLAFGTMTFGGQGGFARVGSTEVGDARRQLDIALEAGVNLVDTADIYSTGRAEEILGEALKGRRDDVVLASKARFPMGPGPNDRGLSRAHLLRACEDSLRRLDTDWIDLYQVHERDGTVPTEETLDALDTLVHQGKVRYVGCSNLSAWHVMDALWTADKHGMSPYVSQQVYYSLLDRDVEYEHIPMAIDRGLGVLVWSPLAGGLLTGKFRRHEARPEGARHSEQWPEPPVHDEDRMYAIIETLIAVAEGRGVSPAQVALNWLMGRPAVTSVIVGARHEGQLRDDLGAAGWTLSDEERARLDEVSRPRLGYPYWHQRSTAADRLSPGDRSLLAQFDGPPIP